MPAEVLLQFLGSGLIDVGGDDAKLEKLRSTAEDLAKGLLATPSKTVSYALVAFDPETPADEPLVHEVLDILGQRWATYVNTFSGPPVTVVRAMLLTALAAAAEEDDGVGLAFVATARNALPFVAAANERDIWVEAIRVAEARVNARAEREWATPDTIAVPALSLSVPDLPASTLECANIDVDALKGRVWAAAGPQAVPPGGTMLGTSGNPHWPNSQQHWNGEFGGRMAMAIAESIQDAINDSTIKQAELNGPLRAVAAALSNHIDAVLSSVSAATAGLQRRTALLWWKEALFSPSVRSSYRELPHPIAAALMAFDLSAQVPVFSPLSVSAFLQEAVRGLPELDPEKTYPLRELVVAAQDEKVLAGLRDTAAGLVSAPAGRGPVLGLISHPDSAAGRSAERFQPLTGLPAQTGLTLPAWAGWIFRELQAMAATATSRKV